MNDTTKAVDQPISLVVLAAGMGSRYGGLKQLDGLGPSGETILEYSIYDAIKAGFSKVVFVVRDFFRDEFAEQIGGKFQEHIDVDYVCQPVNPHLPHVTDLPERTKPWGTSHAVLVTKDAIAEPFAVINADDYYGQGCFQTMARFLREEVAPDHYSMVGYTLDNTLSDRGYVNRGVCTTDEQGHLSGIREVLKIKRDDGRVVADFDSDPTELDANAIVSMNFWGFHQDLFLHLEQGFLDFVRAHRDDPKAEYYIPNIVDDMIRDKRTRVSVLPTDDLWYGVTYQEDAEAVRKAFRDFADQGKYPSPLWSGRS